MAKNAWMKSLAAILLATVLSVPALTFMAEPAAAQTTFSLMTLDQTLYVGTEDLAVVSVVNCGLATVDRSATTTVALTATGGGTLTLTLAEAPEVAGTCGVDTAGRPKGGLFIGSFRFAAQGVTGSERLAITDGATVTATAGTGAGQSADTATWQARFPVDMRVYRRIDPVPPATRSWIPTTSVSGEGANIVQVNVTDRDVTNKHCVTGCPDPNTATNLQVEVRAPRDAKRFTLAVPPTTAADHPEPSPWNRKPGTTTVGCCANFTAQFGIVEFDPSVAAATIAADTTKLHISDGEQFTVTYIDEPVSGKRTLVTQKLVWHRATSGTLSLTESDYLTPYTDTNAIVGTSSTLYVVVTDPDANTNPLTRQNLLVTLRSRAGSGACSATASGSLQDQETVTVFESSPDSGDFLGSIQLDGAIGIVNGKLAVGGTGSCLIGEYLDGRQATGVPATAAATDAALWSTSRGGAVSLRNNLGQVASVFLGSAASTAGGFATIRVVDEDLTSAGVIKAVVRHQDLIQDECNAMRHATGAGNERCRPLVFSAVVPPVAGAFEAKIYFNSAGPTPSITISDGQTFQVDYLDANSATGAKNQFVTKQGVWAVAYDAYAYFEKQSYVSTDTGTVFVVDRDLPKVTVVTLVARVVSGQDTNGAVVTLTRDAAPFADRFKGTFTIETFSATSASDNKVYVENNDTLSVKYEEPADATGVKAFIPGGRITTAKAVHANSPSVNFEKFRYNEGDTVKVQVRDANVPSGQQVIVGTASTPTSGPAAGNNLGRDFAVATGTGGTYEATFGFEGPRFFTQTFQTVADLGDRCAFSVQVDNYPIVAGSEDVTDQGTARQWYRSTAAVQANREYTIDYLTGTISFDRGEPWPPTGSPTSCAPNPPTDTANPIVTSPLTIKYRAYESLTERFVAQGQPSVTLQSHIAGGTPPTLANLADATPYVDDEECMGMPDAGPDVTAACPATGTLHRLVPPDGSTSFVEVTVGGEEWVHDDDFTYDSVTGKVTFDTAIPNDPSKLIVITYRANNVIRTVHCFDTNAAATNCGADVTAFRAGAALTATIPDGATNSLLPFVSTTGATMQLNGKYFAWDPDPDTRTWDVTVDPATGTMKFYVTAGAPTTISRVYLDLHTAVYGNAKFGTQEGVSMTGQYEDAADCCGSNTQTYPVTILGYLGRNAGAANVADVKWARDDRTAVADLFYGYDATATVQVTDTDANTSPLTVESFDVTVESFTLGLGGAGTSIEEEIVTLTETEAASGVFRGSFGFEQSPDEDDGNGKISTGDLLQYAVQVTYDDHFRHDYVNVPNIWARWFRIEPGTLASLAGTYLGDTAELIALVTDGDLAGRTLNTATSGTYPNCAITAAAFDSLAYHEVFVRGEPWVKKTTPAAGLKEYSMTQSGANIAITLATGHAGIACATDVKADYYQTGPRSGPIWVTAKGPLADNLENQFAVPVTVQAASGSQLRNNDLAGDADDTDIPVTFTTDSTTTLAGAPNTLFVRPNDGLKVRYVDRNYAACSTGGVLTESCRHAYGVVREHSATWQNTVDARLFVGTVENSYSTPTDATYTGKPYVFGAERVRLGVVDGDANLNPGAIDTVQVKVTTTTNPAGKNVTLSETKTTSGIFEATFRFNDPALPVSAESGDRFNVAYTDQRTVAGGARVREIDDGPFTFGTNAAILAGCPDLLATAAKSGDCNGAADATEYRWFAAATPTFVLDNGTYSGTLSEERITLTLSDDDGNLDEDVRETLSVTVRSFAAAGNHHGASTGTVRDTETATLTETQADSGLFTGVLGFGTDAGELAVLHGDRLRAEYQDRHNATGGRHTLVYEEADWVDGKNAKIRLNKPSYTSRSELVEVRLIDESTYPTNPVHVLAITPGSLATTTRLQLQPVSGTSNHVFAATFGLEAAGADTDGIPDIAVGDEQTIDLVFLDKDNGASGPALAVAPVKFKVITSTIDLSLVTTPTPDGENGWHKTAPTVDFEVSDPDNALERIEYRFGTTGTFQTFTAPFTIPTDEIYEIVFRAVNVLGEVLPEENATVKYDGTAPAFKVADLNATAVPGGLIEVDVMPEAGLSKDDYLNFGSYKVWMDAKTGDPIASETEDTFTVDPGDEEEHTYYVGIADQAGNVNTGIITESATATADGTAPTLLDATLTPSEFTLELDAPASVLVTARVQTPIPSDFDEVTASVTNPFGGAVTNFSLTASATAGTYTGSFSGWNATGAYAVLVSALDEVGNAGTKTVTLTVRGIDKFPPQVQLVASSVTKGTPLQVRVTDNDKGIKSITYSLEGAATQTVAVTGTPLTQTFEIATTGLALGAHTLLVTATDANATANVATVTLTFSLTQGDVTVGTKPVVGLVRPFAEEGGAIDVRVTLTGTLTKLEFKLDGGTARNALGTPVNGVLSASVAGLAPGAHTILVDAVAIGGLQTTTQELPFTVLPAGVPLPPDTVTVVAERGDVKVGWLASTSASADIGGYLVHRRASPWKVIADVAAGTTTFTDTAPPASDTLAYAVTAYGPNGEGQLDVGADSTANSWFTQVSPQSIKSPAPGSPIWLLALVALAVLVAAGLVYTQRRRLFGGTTVQEEAAAEEPGLEVPAYGAPLPERHQLRCPACGERFAVTGTKPIITNCPSCGRKGILR